MSKIFAPIASLFKNHKLKMLGVLVFAIIFTILIFPYDDLNDLATSKVSQITNNQVYLQFDSLDLSFVPVGLSLGNVSVETQTLPAIKASRLEVSPWLSGLIVGKQGASVDAKELFGGLIAADVRDGDKVASGDRAKNIEVDAKGIKLPQLAKFLSEGNIATFLLQGNLDLSLLANVDPSFAAQPSGEIKLTAENFALPSQTLRTPMMPIAIPDLKFGNTKFSGAMKDGSLTINDLSFGNDSTLSGKITGSLGVSFLRSPMGVQPIVKTYDLKVNLKFPTAFAAANASVLSALYGFIPGTARKDTPKGTEVAFRMLPPAPGSPFPTFTNQ